MPLVEATPPLPSSPPRGLKVTRSALLAWASAAGVAVIAWTLFLVPTDLGSELSTALRAARYLSVMPGNAPPYSRIAFQPTRDTYGSIIGHEIAGLLSHERSSRIDGENAGDTLNRALMRAHSPGAVLAISQGYSNLQRHCTVKISAQALDYVGTPYEPMVRIFGGRQDTFLLLAFHEMAHCHWNGALDFERLLDRPGAEQVALAALMPLAWHITESYADAYALLMASRTDPTYFQRASQALSAKRAPAEAARALHDSSGALSAVVAMVPTFPQSKDPLASRWDVTHRYALSAALTGAREWLIRGGDSPAAALGKLRAFLGPLNIAFELREVAGRQYVIARPGAEPDASPDRRSRPGTSDIPHRFP